MSTVTGSWAGPGALADPAYWGRHARATVRFADAVGVLLRERPGMVLVEVGPGETLSALARQHRTPATAPSSPRPARGKEASPGSGTYRALADAWAAGSTSTGRRSTAVAVGVSRCPPTPSPETAIGSRTGRRARASDAGRAPMAAATTRRRPPTPRRARGRPRRRAAHGLTTRRERLALRITAILADLTGSTPQRSTPPRRSPTSASIRWP
ncbi:MAG: hypothetical protein R3C32_13880 [Chloroflexota bacterium]